MDNDFDIILGEINGYDLTDKKLITDELVDEIKNDIKNLKPLWYDSVTINLKNYAKINEVIFVEIIRNLNKNKTNLYNILINVAKCVEDKFVYCRYEKEFTLKQTLAFFENYCLKDKNINITNTWKKVAVYNKQLDYMTFLDDENDVNYLLNIKNTNIFAKKECTKYFENLKNYLVNKYNNKIYKQNYYKSLKSTSKIRLTNKFAYYQDVFNNKKFYLYKEVDEKLLKIPNVANNLGEIELYGYLGTANYKKAFELFTHASKIGSVKASYNLAMMYKNGNYVEKNYKKYKNIIQNVFFSINDNLGFTPYVDYLYKEMIEIYLKNNDAENACIYAMEYIGETLYGLQDGHFKAYKELDYNFILELLNLLYQYRELNLDKLVFYDMFYLLQKPIKLEFSVLGSKFYIESLVVKGETIVKFNGKYYKNIKDALYKAKILGKLFVEYCCDIDFVKIMGD